MFRKIAAERAVFFSIYTHYEDVPIENITSAVGGEEMGGKLVNK